MKARSHYVFHFIDKETRNQIGEVTCSRVHRFKITGWYHLYNFYLKFILKLKDFFCEWETSEENALKK